MPDTHFYDSSFRARIKLKENIRVTEDGLEALHRAMVYNVPFENLDIWLGRGMDVSPAGIYERVVDETRGGYCFVLNGLFHQALQHYGFESRPLLARVHNEEPTGRTHQLTLVTLNNRQWIADVGFGARSLRCPMPFETGEVGQQDYQERRIIESETWGYLMQDREGDEWTTMYSFDLETVCYGDIVTGNHYTSTSLEVPFTRSRIVSLLCPEGRTAFLDNRLTTIRNGESIQTEVRPEDYLSILEETFGLRLGVSYSQLTRPPA